MRIKTICPEHKGGCGREHFLEVSDDLDEDALEYSRRFAKLTGCRPCSIWQASRLKLEDVQDQNQRTIWEQERRGGNIKKLLTGEPKNAPQLNARLGEIDRVIGMARGDLGLAVREIARLDDARAEQLQQLRA